MALSKHADTDRRVLFYLFVRLSRSIAGGFSTMDYGMIGKIEKAKLYAKEPQRITFHTLTVQFNGDNSQYTIDLSPEGWNCTCPGFKTHHICPHIMALERVFKVMLKRSPLPYGEGQNVVSDVEKAMRYADETDRISVNAFDAEFQGDNGNHHFSFSLEQGWQCNCSFFQSRGVCCHTMAMERILGRMLPVPVAVTTH
ncbi:hypothetical protein FBR02_18825 [Anaerolineae bacterium CFX9]|nr:hypothetical protein [Anaerolineae bacterium CFX9]